MDIILFLVVNSFFIEKYISVMKKWSFISKKICSFFVVSDLKSRIWTPCTAYNILIGNVSFSSAEISSIMRELVEIFTFKQQEEFLIFFYFILQVKITMILRIILKFLEDSDYGNRSRCFHLINGNSTNCLSIND